jgi:hypothetical protein
MNDHIIPSGPISKLLRTGQNDDPWQAIISEFSSNDLIAYSPFMRTLPVAWKQVGNALSESDLLALIKAIVVAEKILSNWGAGSVSPAIWLFRIFEEKYPHGAGQLADWMLAHSNNGWLPYGSSNFGPKSLAEYKQHKREHDENKRSVAESEKARELAAKQRKAEAATVKLFGAVKRNDIKAVVALIEQGADPILQGPDGSSAAELAKSLNRMTLYNAMFSSAAKND